MSRAQSPAERLLELIEFHSSSSISFSTPVVMSVSLIQLSFSPVVSSSGQTWCQRCQSTFETYWTHGQAWNTKVISEQSSVIAHGITSIGASRAKAFVLGEISHSHSSRSDLWGQPRFSSCCLLGYFGFGAKGCRTTNAFLQRSEWPRHWFPFWM